jgi:hypothetical protein
LRKETPMRDGGPRDWEKEWDGRPAPDDPPRLEKIKRTVMIAVPLVAFAIAASGCGYCWRNYPW